MRSAGMACGLEPFDKLRTAPFDKLRTAPFDKLRTAPFEARGSVSFDKLRAHVRSATS